VEDAAPELLYVVVKFVAYSLWCWLGLKLFEAEKARLRDGLGFGAFRWLIGLVFGIAAGIMLGSVNSNDVPSLYVKVYVPLRIVEWSIMLFLMGSRSYQRSAKGWLWMLGGIGVSFLSDLASPEGMAGRFCVGRCLC
jgi:hypothetical protein